MKRITRLLIIFCVLLAGAGLVVVAFRWVDKISRVSMAGNYEFKRMHHAPGKVLSLSIMKPAQQAQGIGEGSLQYKICFSIDSFSDIPSDLQGEYALAEKARSLKDGPQCIISRHTSLPANMKPGDAIEVNYLLYGKGVITVERLVASGQDID